MCAQCCQHAHRQSVFLSAHSESLWLGLISSAGGSRTGVRRRYFSKGPRKDREKKRECVASVNPNHNPFAQMLKGVTGLTCCV